jgi:hypothetical protein
MWVLTGQLRIRESKKGKARHIWPLTLAEKPGLFLVTTLCKKHRRCFFLCPLSLGMLTSWGDLTLQWCWAADVGLLYVFAFWRVLEKVVSEGAQHQSPPTSHLSPQPWKNPLCSIAHTFFHLNVVLGLKRSWHTKLPSKAVTRLTAKRFGRDGQLCVGGHGKNRAEQIKPEDSKREVWSTDLSRSSWTTVILNHVKDFKAG